MTEIDLTPLVNLITTLREMNQTKAILEENIAKLRQRIEDAMGENDTGLVNGKAAIRWTTVTSRRFDQTLAKERIPAEMLAKCYTETTTRPFKVLTND